MRLPNQPPSSATSQSPANQTPPDGLHRLWLFCICAGMLVFFIQVTVLFPVLPLYLIQRWDDAPVGWVVGAMAAGLLLFRPATGWMIDRWGRKIVLWVGLGLMLVVLPLYIWSPDPNWMMGVRVLHGMSQAAFATASQTMLADLVPPHRRTAMLGYLAMSNTIGFSVGPLLGSLTFVQSGFRSVVLIQGALTMLGIGLSLPLPWLRGSKKASQSTANESGETVGEIDTPFPWETVLRFPVRDATLVFFVGSFLHGAVVTFLPLFVANSALFFSLNALVAIFVRFGLGRWGHRVSKRWVVSLGVCCSGSALVGMAIAPLHLMLWSILYGLGFGTLFPVLSAIVSLAAPVSVRGRVYSVFLAGFDSGMTLGGAGAEPLVAIVSLKSLFLMLGGVGWGASLFALRQFSQPIPIRQFEE